MSTKSKRKVKEDEETYILTFRGFMSMYIKDEDHLKQFMDDLELFLRRNYSGKDSYPAIVFDGEDIDFAEVSKQ